ncbi:receptor-type tyrosine-protein phosphatase eta [Pangshura tecta]
MKQPGQLCLRLLLLLCLAKIEPAAACFEDCSSVNVHATMTEIDIDPLPKNLTISNVTFANGTLFQNSSLNNSIGGLSPGVQYIINFQNGTEACCKNITTSGPTHFPKYYSLSKNVCVFIFPQTEPSPVSDIQATNISTEQVTLAWKNNDTAAPNYTYVIYTDGNGISPTRTQTSQNKSAVIGGLQPGTLYNFTIVPLAADKVTKGDPEVKHIYTMPTPVFNIEVSNVSTHEVSLRWENKDDAASEYSYRILIANEPSSTWNMTSNTTKAVITNLNPGTFYQFTIFPRAADNTEGGLNLTSIYTMPTPVFNIEVSNVSTHEVSLRWENKDAAASEYSYRILIANEPSSTWNMTSNTTKAVITNLNPGTFYQFTIFPRAADKTEGDPNSTLIYTKPSPVSDIQATNIGTEQLTLTWKNDDTAAPNYTYVIYTDGNGISPTRTQTSQNKSAVIGGLQPGTLYNFTIVPLAADKVTKGDPVVKHIYTKPSPVFDIQATNISTEEVTLIWKNDDTAASSYTYVIYTDWNGISPTQNQTSQNKNAVIRGLWPGTPYNFTIVPLAADNVTKGDPKVIDICTEAAQVPPFNCIPVTKEPKLTLKWEPPAGNSTGFSINTFSDAWSNKTLVVAGSLETTVTNLNYSTSYNVSIITSSCGKASLPQQTTCDTSITDPPAPAEKPIIMSFTHNSFKIQFSGFEPKNGPLKAYAIVITTSKEDNIPSNSSLNYTYHDFKENKRKTYITRVINTMQMRAFSSRSDSSQYEMEVGDASKSHAYSNGPLEPLGSYRASVAGFTKIEFNEDELIVEEKSYVSFTPYSQEIKLPPDPAVIAGAVVGCILGAVAISAVVVFIFWRRRRKDGKNSELPFSPIRSKPIKVENFESYFKKQQADSNCGFAEEYEELRSVGINQPKFAAELAENRGKNRYNNVLPYDISRVKLSIQNHPTDDYINANYMPGYNSKKEFIAAQGPLPNTVQDFWRMIWEKNIYAIVMLTKCVEQGRTKCEEYWPDKGSNYYDDFTVTLVSEYVLPEWTIRDFTVEDSDATESHSVRQFHFTSWPDHGVPETTDLLINFRHLVQENIRQNPPGSPTLVHCSAGVGRTGTFIAIDHLIQQIEMENTSNVYGVVYDLRMHRPLMVQTEDQYVFLNQCVLDIIKSQRNKKSDLIYQNATAMAIYENFAPTPGFEKANGYHA